MTATPDQLTELQRINAQWNAIPFEALGVDAGEDNWIEAPVPGQVWECRDYVAAKAKALREGGWSVGDMSVVLCYTEPESAAPGEPAARAYHAVLGCSAGGVLYILDNRVGTVYPWDHPVYDYVWLHQQIPDTLTWRDASAGLVASATGAAA